MSDQVGSFPGNLTHRKDAQYIAPAIAGVLEAEELVARLRLNSIGWSKVQHSTYFDPKL